MLGEYSGQVRFPYDARYNPERQHFQHLLQRLTVMQFSQYQITLLLDASKSGDNEDLDTLPVGGPIGQGSV